MFSTGIAFIGSGSAAPAGELTNDDLSKIVDTNDEWIASRTGIKTRQIAAAEISLCELATAAGRAAIADAGITAAEIDLIILATSTPDDLFGSASKIQNALGATKAVAFDLTAACSGFVFALVNAAQFIRTGTYQNVLVIGADILSRWLDWSDRRTCVLFGDGAGAVVCQATNNGDRLKGFEICSNGAGNDCLNLPYSGSPQPLTETVSIAKGTYQPIFMKGREVYRFAVAKVPEVIEKALFRADRTVEEIDWLILHQANQRIMNSVADRLKIPPEKVISNVARYGNTSAASIPLALDEAIKSGKIKPGDLIATSGFGAGLTWGAAIFEWG
ncbi:MAG: beta-ketoacyl-ACP synthase III [Prochloraceae cyanobacterium]